MSVRDRLHALARRHELDAVYAFGSRADEIAKLVRGEGPVDSTNRSDVDIGVLPSPDHDLDVRARVQLAGELEDLFGVSRVDVVLLPQAPAYLASDVVAGDLIACVAPVREAEYQLFVLRRAGDLAFFERERRRQLLGSAG